MEKWLKLTEAINILVPNEKLSFATVNSLRRRNGLIEGIEYDPIGEYHWKLAKIQIDSDWIGLLYNNHYYKDVLLIDIENMKILETKKPSKVEYVHWMSLINRVESILSNYRNNNAKI